jgi:hypothetical protein
LTLFGTGHQAFKQVQGGDFRVSIMKDEPDYSGLSSNQKLLLRPMHEKSPEDRITAKEALKLLEKLSPSASARPIAKPAVKAKPVAKKPPVKVPAKAKAAVQQLQAAAQKVPPGIELLPNGARVAGWKAKEKRPTLADMPAGYWLLIASILTAGLALIPWGLYKFFARSTRGLDRGIRRSVPLHSPPYFRFVCAIHHVVVGATNRIFAFESSAGSPVSTHGGALR